MSKRLAIIGNGMAAGRLLDELARRDGLSADEVSVFGEEPHGCYNRILLGRALRSFADGFIAVVLPAYLLALGMGQLDVGVISTATLLGSAAMTLAVGRWGHRFSIRRLLLTAALLMAATGAAFAGLRSSGPAADFQPSSRPPSR